MYTLVGITHKSGTFESEKTKEQIKFDNITLHVMGDMEEAKEGDFAIGCETLDPVKIKYDDFKDITGIFPTAFLNEAALYLNQPVEIFKDLKQRLSLVRLHKAELDKATGEVKAK